MAAQECRGGLLDIGAGSDKTINKYSVGNCDNHRSEDESLNSLPVSGAMVMMLAVDDVDVDGNGDDDVLDGR